jgi:hypothetical protein
MGNPILTPLDPFRFVPIAVAGGKNKHQPQTIDYLREENRVLRELRRHGVEPAPQRSRSTTWKEFLSRHWELLVAADFFPVEVGTRRELQRLLVLFFMERTIATRCSPPNAWNSLAVSV